MENVMSENVPIDTMSSLANLIRAARLQQGFTRDELASATGLSPKFISQVEAGKPTAQIGKVILLLGELGIRLFAQSSVEISQETAIKASRRRRISHGS
jgi:transcriptional regulator with XRE-family HTH domain